MKGRSILIEPRDIGGAAAALVVDGRLEDLAIDPDPADPSPQLEAIHLAVAGRPMKGLGGGIVDLGGGASGFLRLTPPPAPGTSLLVQVDGWAEPGKAVPVTARIALRSRLAVLTPGAPGLNVSRAIPKGALRDALAGCAADAMRGAPESLGLILRSRAAEADAEALRADIAGLRANWSRVSAAAVGLPGCVAAAPGAAGIARRDWVDPDDTILEDRNALADAGVWEEVAGLADPIVRLSSGMMAVEATRALVAVDVNTAGDPSPAAALKANLAAARELPRQLRLRGLGGQVTVDFAPLAKRDRPRVESVLRSALRADSVPTSLAGWTRLGNFELLRKRDRRPLAGLPRRD